jgi:HEAT repeat protein
LVAVNALVPEPTVDAGQVPDALGVAFEIAAGGEAYVRLADPQSLYMLTSYLLLPGAKRYATVGITALVRLVASASLPLRESALDRLTTIDALDSKVSPDARQMLLLVVSDDDQPLVVRRKVLTLIGQRKLGQFREDLASLLRRGSTIDPDVIDAIAELDGGLSADLVQRSLGDRNPAVRAAAVRGASMESYGDRLATLMRSDPSPLVRAEAARTLARRGGIGSLQEAAEGLWDSAVLVRSGAARALGQRGEPAIPLLRQVAWSGSVKAAEAAVLGLAVSSDAGEPALREIVAEHPRAAMRKLAWLAILRF